MAEGSVAPKERVIIQYKPATGNAQEEVELPLQLVMMGDYTGRQDATPLEKRPRINIDKDNFDKVMETLCLLLELNVRDVVSGQESTEMPVHLEFKKLKDFEPESIAQQVPELNRLLDLREALRALRGPLGAPAFRRAIQNLLANDSEREKLLKALKLADTAG